VINMMREQAHHKQAF